MADVNLNSEPLSEASFPRQDAATAKLDTLATIADALAQGIALDLHDSNGRNLLALASNPAQLRGTIPCSPAEVTLEVSNEKSEIANRRENTRTPFIGVRIPSMQVFMKQIGGMLEIESGDRGTTIRAMVSTA
jgi:signal transduction histidine kinase